MAETELIIKVQWIAKKYGARREIDSVVYEACVDLIMEQFSGLGIEEIEHAYQLWAAGKIDALEMYGGEFNATQLGRVLSSYKKWRMKIVRAYLDEKEKQEKAEAEAKKAEELKDYLYDNMPEMLRAGKEKYDSWQNVPVHWFDVCWHLHLIRFSEEKKAAYLKRATELAKQEQRKDIEALQSSPGLGEAQSRDLTARAKAIARKLAVYDLIQNYEFADDCGI